MTQGKAHGVSCFPDEMVTLTVTDNGLASRSYQNWNQVLNNGAFDMTKKQHIIQ